MREIKFEFAGQQSDGNWILSRPFTLPEIGIGWVHQFVASSNPPIHFDKLIARQFTGLKDSQGKEIYEKDILEIPGSREFHSVHFSTGMFKAGATIYGPEFRRCKIIGNIYENPNLVTQ